MMRERKLDILLTPLFVAAITLLLANDFVLKPLFHNWFTGKLSDFAGLFAFFLFWSAIFPRHPRVVGWSIVFGFVYWKSVWSQPVIDWWNDLPLYRIGRIVDPTDLFALIVLPVAYRYARSVKNQEFSRLPLTFGFQIRRIAIWLMCMLSIFAFGATKLVNDRSTYVNRDYEIDLTKSSVISKLHKIGLTKVEYRRASDDDARLFKMSDEEREKYDLEPATKYCKSSITAHVTLHNIKGKTTLKLGSIQFWCDHQTAQDDEAVLQIFEREVIEKLRAK